MSSGIVSDENGAETPSSDTGIGKMPRREAHVFDPMSGAVNMTNCYKHLEDFFSEQESIHFNLLIAYWIMAGFLDPVDSVMKAYRKGHDILMRLTYKEKILEPIAYGKDGDMIKLASSTDSTSRHCRHPGFCTKEDLGLFDLFGLHKVGKVILTNGMLMNKEGTLLLLDGKHMPSKVSCFSRRLKYLAYFNPLPGSVELLLENANQLSVLILRGCQLLLCCEFRMKNFRGLSVLEISGSSDLTRIYLYDLEHLPNLRCLILRGISNLHPSFLYPYETFNLEVLHLSQCPSFFSVRFDEPSPLRYLNLSGVSIERLPDTFFPWLTKLRWLILRGNLNLKQLPSIKDLRDLQLLDLSHCTSLGKLMSQIIYAPRLQMVDLSYTLLNRVPFSKESSMFTHLFLRDSKLSVFVGLAKLIHLQVLDLSGTSYLHEVDLSQHYDLVLLDLSGTQIKNIDSVSEMTCLRKLIVQNCGSLQRLPKMGKLTSLEVLDISGCKELSDFPDISDITKLEVLDLSGTKLKCLPSFVNRICVRKLSLRGLELDSIETLTSPTSLLELDLSSVKISSLQEFKVEFLQPFQNLQILNLSSTSVADLTSLSNLTSLKEILLADCPYLSAMPDLETLPNLATLDLSISEDSSIHNCPAEIASEDQRSLHLSLPGSLRKVLLTNRTGLQELFPLKTPCGLEFLDLRGTDVSKFPCENMSHIKRMRLPAKIDLSSAHLGRMGNLQKELVWDGNISDPTEICVMSSTGNTSLISAGANQFFHLRNNQGSWEAFVNQFSASKCACEGENEVSICLKGDEFIFRDDHSFLARRLPNLELKGRSVEIHGFPQLPGALPKLLQQANNVAMVGNDFSCSISDLCSEAIDVLCIKDCPNMQSLLIGGEKNGQVSKCPERLVISHLPRLESIFDKNRMEEISEPLKHIHVDCCPQLDAVLENGVAKNLETLCIKFCDKARISRLANATLSKLQKLFLLELPGMDDIWISFPSLRTLSISQCLKLTRLNNVVKSARVSLEQLSVDCCPKLQCILPCVLDMPEKLQVLKISSCDRLLSLVMSTGPSSSSLPLLRSLEILRLWNLPKLERIRGELPSEFDLNEFPELLFAADLPSLKILSISQCPNVNNLDAIIKSARASLEELLLDSCPLLEHALPSFDLPEKLRVLKISSCTGLVTLFNMRGPSSSSLSPRLDGLQALRLLDLPKLESIGGELSSVKFLELDGSLPAHIIERLNSVGN